MQIGSESKIIILKLTNDEDVFKSLEKAINAHNIRSGVILSGIGMLKEFELGYFDPEGYKTTFFKEPHELVSMSGSIAYGREDPTKMLLHVHCTVANRNHQVYGGHLNKGIVNVVNEITLLRLDDLNLNRIKNEKTGLMELNIDNPKIIGRRTMLEKLDHIGIAVNNIDDALEFYRDQLGLELGGIEEVPEQKVKVAFMQIGESRIELLQSTNPEGPVAKYIEKRGQGIQHIAIRVDNIESTLEELKAKGAKLIDEQPRIGAGGAKIAFVHPKSTRGLLLELCEH